MLPANAKEKLSQEEKIPTVTLFGLAILLLMDLAEKYICTPTT